VKFYSVAEVSHIFVRPRIKKLIRPFGFDSRLKMFVNLGQWAHGESGEAGFKSVRVGPGWLKIGRVGSKSSENWVHIHHCLSKKVKKQPKKDKTQATNYKKRSTYYKKRATNSKANLKVHRTYAKSDTTIVNQKAYKIEKINTYTLDKHCQSSVPATSHVKV
jgi:hypothetical protein